MVVYTVVDTDWRTAAPTVVTDRLGPQVEKWAARRPRARRAPRRSAGARPATSARRLKAVSGARTATAMALRQKAMASLGAWAARMRGADVDTAATATAMSTRSPAAGRATTSGPPRTPGARGVSASAMPPAYHEGHACTRRRRSRPPVRRGQPRPGRLAAPQRGRAGRGHRGERADGGPHRHG